MSQAKPSVVGSAFSLTVGVGYTLCAIIVAIFPGPAYNLFAALFHGGDVSMLQPAAGVFTFGSYFVSLVALMVSGYVMGAFYSYVLGYLSSSIRSTLREAR
jgi:hypothetical protein